MRLSCLCFILLSATIGVHAAPIFFSTGDVNGQMAMASRPSSAGKIEIEAADDFLLTTNARITSATFTGLLTGGATIANIDQVVVEIYRVFPSDSDVTRTSGPPTFSTSQVPTRVNSPSDVELDGRDSGMSELSFTASVLATTVTASNSVLNGIHSMPGQTTGGDGVVTGTEILLSTMFATPFELSAGHYFFVPQVGVTTANGNFYWLSGTRPIVAPGGTPFAPDLQAWIRNQNLDPDWLRVGTDIVGGTTPPTFNGAFTLTGESVPEPATWALVPPGIAVLLLLRRRREA